MKIIKCPHYDGDGYVYMLDDKTELCVCCFCNMNLAGEIAKQQAIHTFLPEIKEDSD